MPTYKTQWKQGNRKGNYVTKSLTEFHQSIHENHKTDYAMTTVVTGETWAFGAMEEILAITNRAKNKFQPFPAGTEFVKR